MADNNNAKTDGNYGTSLVVDQTIMEMVMENQVMIRSLLTSLPTTIASTTAAALRHPQCVPKQQPGVVNVNNR